MICRRSLAILLFKDHNEAGGIDGVVGAEPVIAESGYERHIGELEYFDEIGERECGYAFSILAWLVIGINEVDLLNDVVALQPPVDVKSIAAPLRCFFGHEVAQYIFVVEVIDDQQAILLQACGK